MTAETVLLSVLTKCGLTHSEPQITSTDFQTKEVVDLMNETGNDLARRADWPALIARQLFSSATGSTRLPSDFVRLRAVWIGSAQSRLMQDHGTFKMLQDAGATEELSDFGPYHHISGLSLLFAPKFGTVGGEYQYVSAFWCESGTALASNGEEISLPEHLMVSGTVWRWKRKKGLPFDDDLAQHEAELAEALALAKGAA